MQEQLEVGEVVLEGAIEGARKLASLDIVETGDVRVDRLAARTAEDSQQQTKH